ncbi:MAG: DUF6108 family protein [Bacteroidales bacterium]|nr:DUF6108 family protein [Bacteroidales bacterium]
MSIRRLTLMLCAALISAIGAWAQKGLAIEELFDGRYKKDPQAVVTNVRGDALNKYDLSLYRSISIQDRETDIPQMVELVTTDGSQAVDSETSYRGGALYYAFYRLPRRNDRNCYILYLNQHLDKGDKVLLIYLEGEANTKQVKAMLKK